MLTRSRCGRRPVGDPGKDIACDRTSCFHWWALGCIGFYATSDGKTPATTPAATEEGLAVYFSPKGGCTEAVVDALGKARQTVLVQAYPFTSAPIAPCGCVSKSDTRRTGGTSKQ